MKWKVISISGPPTPAFADAIGASWIIKTVLSLISFGIKKKAKKLTVDYSFLFMRADGKQLSEITPLIEQDVIRPVLDRVFPFGQANEALEYIESGRAKGKIVIKLK